MFEEQVYGLVGRRLDGIPSDFPNANSSGADSFLFELFD
jgi:hypothetical protein